MTDTMPQIQKAQRTKEVIYKKNKAKHNTEAYHITMQKTKDKDKISKEIR